MQPTALNTVEDKDEGTYLMKSLPLVTAQRKK
jgi:hypothetical protein